MRSITRCAISLVLAISFVVGCTASVDCVLLNHSEASVTMVRQSGSGVDKIQINPGEKVVLNSWTSTNFYRIDGDRAWKYVPALVPESFVSIEGFGPWSRRVVVASLESDGRIYLLGGGANAGAIPAQPHGFPLNPSQQNMSEVPK